MKKLIDKTNQVITNAELWLYIDNEESDLLDQYLNRNALNLNEVNNYSKYQGLTPLQYAAMNGLDEIVKVLLKHNADINMVDSKYSRTPLHFAVIGRHLETVKMLLNDDRIDLLKKDTENYYPLEYACIDFDVEMEILGIQTKLGSNKNQKILKEIILAIFEKHEITRAYIPYSFNELHGKKTTIPQGAYNVCRIIALRDCLLKDPKKIQHPLWLGDFYHNNFKDHNNDDFGICNYKMAYEWYKKGALLILGNEKNINDATVKVIKEFEEFILEWKGINGEFCKNIIEECKIENNLSWQSYKKMSISHLWMELAKKDKKPADTPDEINFPYHCYLFAIKEFKFGKVYKSNSPTITPNNHRELEEAVNYCMTFLSQTELNENTKNEIIKFASVYTNKIEFLKKHNFKIPDSHSPSNKVISFLIDKSKDLPELNFFIARMYLAFSMNKEFKKVMDLISHEALKTLLYCAYLKNTSDEKKHVGGKATVISMLTGIRLDLQNLTGIYFEEKTAVIDIATNILENYKNDPIKEIQQNAKDLLEIYTSWPQPSAPMNIPDTQSIYPDLNMKTGQTIINDIENVQTTLPVIFTETLIQSQTFPEKNNLIDTTQNIISSPSIAEELKEQLEEKNPIKEATLNFGMIITSSQDQEKDNKSDVIINGPKQEIIKKQYLLPPSDQIAAEKKLLEDKILELEKQKKSLEEQHKYLSKVEEFDKKLKISAKEMAKNNVWKRYKSLCTDQSATPEYPDKEALKNPFLP